MYGLVSQDPCETEYIYIYNFHYIAQCKKVLEIKSLMLGQILNLDFFPNTFTLLVLES